MENLAILARPFSELQSRAAAGRGAARYHRRGPDRAGGAGDSGV